MHGKELVRTTGSSDVVTTSVPRDSSGTPRHRTKVEEEPRVEISMALGGRTRANARTRVLVVAGYCTAATAEKFSALSISASASDPWIRRQLEIARIFSAEGTSSKVLSG